MKKITFYTFSGWGLPHDYLRHFIPATSSYTQEKIFYDRGYFPHSLSSSSPELKNGHFFTPGNLSPTENQINLQACGNVAKECKEDGQEYVVTLCNSLGLHFVKEEILEKTDLLVLIGCFLQFLPDDPKESIKTKKILSLMKKGLLHFPKELLKEFYQKSEILQKMPKELNPPLLFDDLSLLETNKLRIDSLKKIPKILLFHAKNDPIVPFSKSMEIQKTFPQSTLQLFDKGSHCLEKNTLFIQKCIEETISSAFWRKKVALHFSKKAEKYANFATLQKKVAIDLGSFLPDLFSLKPKSSKKLAHLKTPEKENSFSSDSIHEGEEKILEIGCGSGFFTSALLVKYPSTPLIASDISQDMLKIAKKNISGKNVTFCLIDGENLPAKDTYPLICSSLVFQWFFNMPKAITSLYEALKKKGILLFSFLENESFPEWKKICARENIPFTGNTLPTEKEVSAILTLLNPNCQIEYRTYTIPYESPFSFFSHLKNIGAGAKKEKKTLTPYQMKRLMKSLQKDVQNPIEVTYRVGFVAIQKL